MAQSSFKSIAWIIYLVLVLMSCVGQTVAQEPTVGCENCPKNTTCINEMCYIVVAAPPGMDSKCNEAYCKVEKGGTCINDQCVVVQEGISLAPSGSPASTPSSPDTANPASSSGFIVKTSFLVMLFMVVYVAM